MDTVTVMENRITDIHTHFLPRIDDGSKSVEESAQMLKIMADSGVKRVVATPHYYQDKITVDKFLGNRTVAYEKIRNYIPEGMQVKLGAEVKLEYDIHKQDLGKLTIEGTDYILIELPYMRWDPWIFDELFKITSKHNLDIIIAHIDRYTGMIPDKTIRELFKMDLKYQVNVDCLGGFFKKSSSMDYIKNNIPHFIGSDCHNLTSRPPCLGDAVKKIERKFGKERIEYYMANSDEIFK